MRYLPLIWKSVRRAKRRTLLTVLAVSVTIFILVGMISISTAFGAWEDSAAMSLRVAVLHKAGFDASLPLAMEKQLASIPDVVAVKKTQWFGGIYRDSKEFFPTLVTDFETLFEVWSEIETPEDQRRALMADRTGCMVGDRLARRFGWKLGDRITLKGTIFPFNAELTLRAIYRDPWEQETTLWFDFDYFREMMGGQANPGWFWLKARTPESIPKVIQEIESRYENSPHPVRALPEQEFARVFTSMLGNIKGLVRNFGYLLAVMLLLATGSTMAMSVQERVREVAVMKALGFTPVMVFLFILSEALLVSIGGAVMGAGTAYVMLDMFELGATFSWGKLTVYRSTVGWSFGVAFVVGILSGGIPALRSAGVSIVEGLRSTD